MNKNEGVLKRAMQLTHIVDPRFAPTHRHKVQICFTDLSYGINLDSKIVNKRTMRYARNFDK